MVPVFALVLAASPELALLSSSGDVAELRFQPLAAAPLSSPVVRFSHADGSPVLGSLLPGTRVVVASAVMQARGDVSFSSALVRLEAGKGARVLADGLAYGSRPLVTSEGRVFVSRGVAGAEQPTGRVDALTIDEVDPVTARVRTVYSARGFWLFLVGQLGREVLVYESTETGGRLLAVHADTLGVRVLDGHFKAMAHDFVVDAPRKRVLFTQRGETSWEVHETSLTDGRTKVLASGPEVTLLPAVRADGRVLISRGEGKGHASLDQAEVFDAKGPGFERFVLERGPWLVVLHERPSEFPSLVVLRSGERVAVATPPESRLDVAGVLP